MAEQKTESPVAVVTGAGSGLGQALAIDLAAQGFAILVHFHSSADGAAQTVDRIRNAGGNAESVQADLTTEQGAIALAIDARSHFGRVDVLVNNSGVYVADDLQDLSEADWFTGMNSTATATFFTTRALLPDLKTASRGGRVINIGDGSCAQPGARDLAMGYHIGKTGVWMLTQSFGKAAAGDGVAVNMVSPGLLESSVGLAGDAEADGVPAGRYGTFDDVSSAVRFLATTENTYLTGANLTVGGGWNL